MLLVSEICIFSRGSWGMYLQCTCVGDVHFIIGDSS